MATTPEPPGRHSQLATIGNNQRRHSVRTGSRALKGGTDRPDAPVFLQESLFLDRFCGTQAHDGTALAPAAVTTATTTTATIGRNSKKRTVTEILDLTLTTNSPDLDHAPAPSARSERLAKKPRVPLGDAAHANPQPSLGTTTAEAAKKRFKKHERVERQEKLAQESATWRAKYKKAFPSFTFYFDALDEPTKAHLGSQVKKLGASVDQFFSKKVTHVVTCRAVPAQSNKENVDAPAPSGARAAGAQLDSTSKTKKARSPRSYALLSGQNLRPHAGDLDKNPFIDSQDILSKAVDFKLKIWHLDKLNLILNRINSRSPNKVDASLQRDQSLPSLLRDEQLYGTRERDPFVPRSDMHYFPAHKYYILVEDSTGEHRPIVIQEYDKPRSKHEDPTWPVLYGGIEGRSGFFKPEGDPGPRLYAPGGAGGATQVKPQSALENPSVQMTRDETWLEKEKALTNLKTQLMAGFSTTAARAVGAPNLRRAISLQNVPRAGTALQEQQTQDAQAQETTKHAAPGGIRRRDSYIAASGNSQIITSNTGTSTRSGAAMQPGTGKGAVVDKRLAVLAGRTVSVALAGGGGGAGSKKEKAVKRSVSVDSGQLKKLVRAREEPKKPGYCENCRVKYEDFKTHIVSNKHRRFALADKNWVELDALLELIERPVLVTYDVSSPSSEGSSEAAYDEEDEYDDSGFFDMIDETGHPYGCGCEESSDIHGSCCPDESECLDESDCPDEYSSC
ncbi:protein serine/threonine kinase activating protein DBF4 [Sporobolomyces koalae]|uniref:protein serine/threonine kinase activating protein DBF4 n=1 Tax=Sporobolomyces koalae TaxID=500713 RepID=UPI00316BF627